MKRIHTIAVALLAAASLGLVAAHAQPFGGGYGPGYGYGPGMMGPGGGYGPGMGRGPGGAWGDPVAAAQYRLTALHAQLNITSAQQTAWDGFAQAVTAQAQQMLQFRTQMQQSAATTNAADRMTQHAQFMQQRAQGTAAVAHAFNALYGTLTTEQRALLDQRPGWGRGFGPFGG